MVRASRNRDPHRIAEQFFLNLRRVEDQPLIEEGYIEVLYPEHFAPGKAVLVVGVPVKNLPLGTGRKLLDSMQRGPYSPFLDGDRGKLVFFIPCPHLRPDDAEEVLRTAHRNKEWAKRTFRFRHAILSPGAKRIVFLLRHART
ncbi:MAG TPA: hypothetical protein VFP46_01095 [Candidatus Paceibacterota bacterium]|nr:hypothetical protein [Candidatus Paceibacterota bacterium]